MFGLNLNVLVLLRPCGLDRYSKNLGVCFGRKLNLFKALFANYGRLKQSRFVSFKLSLIIFKCNLNWYIKIFDCVEKY